MPILPIVATPFTAGVMALMIDTNPTISPSSIKTTLMNTAQNWGPAGTDIDYGAGRLQAYEAIKSVGKLTGVGPVVPNHSYESGYLTTSKDYDNWTINVSSTNNPIAVTLTITNWASSFWFGGSPDFDLYLYDPLGNLVAKSEGVERQELVTYTPSATGNYTIKVSSYSGSGDYFLDSSSN